MKKAILTFIVMFNIIGIFSSLEVYGGTKSEEYKTFTQSDKRWGNYVYDESNLALKDAGCLITSISVLMGYANPDLQNVESWNPRVASEKFEFDGNGSLFWHSPEKYDTTFRFLGKYYEGSKLDKKSATKMIVDLMKQGYYVIVKATGLYADGISHYSPIVGVLKDEPILWDVYTGKGDTYDKIAEFGIDEICVYESTLNKSYDVMLSDKKVKEFRRKSLENVIKPRLSLLLKVGGMFKW